MNSLLTIPKTSKMIKTPRMLYNEKKPNQWTKQYIQKCTKKQKITWTRKYNEIWTPKEIGEHIKGFLHRTNNTIRGYKTIILKSIDFDNNYVWTVLCTTKLEALLVNEHDDKVISLEWLRNEEYNLHVEK